MTDTLAEKAVVGRLVEFAYRRVPNTYLPGIITSITDDPASLRIRLGSARSTIAVRADYENLRYLDQVMPVPELPVGRFHPTVADMQGEFAGVPVCEFEDGDVLVLTAEPAAARAALAAYCTEMDMGLELVDLLEAHWVVFEWQPEDAECPWLMDFAKQGDDMAIQIHYLPA